MTTYPMLEFGLEMVVGTVLALVLLFACNLLVVVPSLCLLFYDVGDVVACLL